MISKIEHCLHGNHLYITTWESFFASDYTSDHTIYTTATAASGDILNINIIIGIIVRKCSITVLVIDEDFT